MPAVDNFTKGAALLTSPFDDGFNIVPSDAAELASIPRGIYIGAPGDVRVLMRSGADLTYKGLQAGSILPVRAIKVFATGTTASDLIGGY